MDYTREPIIETVITPKDGWTLVIRSSKSVGQEEYFVDAVEVVTFGSATFFRSQERPKSFMVPVSDYEVVEVRETRMVLKNITLDRSIKIGSGKEFSQRQQQQREAAPERVYSQPVQTSTVEAEEPGASQPAQEEAVPDVRLDKKRDRKRNFRRKRGREDVAFRDEESSPRVGATAGEGTEGAPSEAPVPLLTAAISCLLPPPPTLISETIARYKDNALFKGAFYSKEELTTNEDEEKEELTPEEEVSIIEGDDDLGSPELPEISLDYPIYAADERFKDDIPEEGIPLPLLEGVQEVPAEKEESVLAPSNGGGIELGDAPPLTVPDDELPAKDEKDI